jgi:hypothetical protein
MRGNSGIEDRVIRPCGTSGGGPERCNWTGSVLERTFVRGYGAAREAAKRPAGRRSRQGGLASRQLENHFRVADIAHANFSDAPIRGLRTIEHPQRTYELSRAISEPF